MYKIIGVLLITTIFTAVILFISRNALPSSNLYSFRRIYEKVNLISKSNPEQKTEYLQLLLDERLKELKIEFKSKEAGFILSSSLRYSATAGELTSKIIENKMKVEAIKTDKQFLKHINELIYLIKDSSIYEKKFVEDDINYLKIYREQLAALK